MAFKGTRNVNGRPKGALNKNTISIKESFKKLIEDNIDLLTTDLKALTPKDRVKAISDLARYVVPTLKQADVEVTNNSQLLWLTQELENYTDEEIEGRINKRLN